MSYVVCPGCQASGGDTHHPQCQYYGHYSVTCARCGAGGTSTTFIVEEGDEWECPPCNARETARERAELKRTWIIRSTAYRALMHADREEIRQWLARRSGVQPACFAGARYRGNQRKWIPMLAYQHRRNTKR